MNRLMKIVNIGLKALQVLLIIIGVIMFVMNAADTSKLTLPSRSYEEVVFLGHILNAVQAIVVFVAAIALETIISKTETKEK